MFGTRLRELRKERSLSMDKMIELYNIKYAAKMNKSTLSRYENGLQNPIFTVVKNLADFFEVPVDYMSGVSESKFNPPSIAEEFVTYPILGDIAAGYDHIAEESWDGEFIDVPLSYLAGRKKDDYFVLRVKGDSMYPTYHNGDKVLILKQSTLDYSGQIGAVLYDNDLASLKKVEYKMGEDWLRLIPINPSFPPIRIENENLEGCRVLGVPKMLIREINE